MICHVNLLVFRVKIVIDNILLRYIFFSTIHFVQTKTEKADEQNGNQNSKDTSINRPDPFVRFSFTVVTDQFPSS